MKKKTNVKIRKKSYEPFAFTMPAHIILLITAVFPILFNLYLSMQNMNVYNFTTYKFVGLEQYKKILFSLDFTFLAILLRTILWTVVNIALEVILGFVIAMLLNIKNLRGKGIYRTLIVLPWAIPAYISALVWKGMFNYDFGIINGMLNSIGLSNIEWLTNPTNAFIACIIVNVWMATPFLMVVILGGLQSIDYSLYEAAQMDGATTWKQIVNITIPLLKPVVMPAIILTAFVTFKQFDVIFILTEGLAGKIDLIITYNYTAFQNNNYSYSAAFSMIIFIMLVALTLINKRYLERGRKNG